MSSKSRAQEPPTRQISLMSQKRTFRGWLIIIFAVGLLIRIPVLIPVINNPDVAILASDSREYLALANNLIEFGVYSAEKDPPPLPVEHNRTPTYALFLLPFVYIWGEVPAIPVTILQLILGAGIGCLAGLLGKQLLNESVGVMAGWVAILSPISVVMSAFIYTEIVFTVLLLGGLCLMLYGIDNQRRWSVFFAGALLAAATLTRPILLPILLVIGFGALLYAGFDRRRVVYALGTIFLAYILVTPWMARNAQQFGRFSLTTISDTNLYYYNAASLRAHLTGQSLDDARLELAVRLEQMEPDDSRWPAARERALAREIILQTPLAFAWYNGVDALNGFRPGFSFMLSLFAEPDAVGDIIRTFTDGTIRDALQVLHWQNAFILLAEVYMLAYLVILTLSMLAGAALLIVEKRWALLILALGVSSALLYLPGIASNARFRMPVEPLFAVVAAYVWFSMVQKFYSNEESR